MTASSSHPDAALPAPRTPETAQRSAVNRRILNRKVATTAATLAVLGAIGVLSVTDLRGRAEVRRTTTALVAADNHLTQARTSLLGVQLRLKTSAAQVRTLETSLSQTDTDLATTNAAVSSVTSGLFFGGFDISALDSCLSGVTQALDQVAVGQTTGALSSLGAVSTSCNAARPAGG